MTVLELHQRVYKDGKILFTPVYVNIEKIIAIEVVPLASKVETFNIYFDSAVWYISVDDYDKLTVKWLSLPKGN